MNILHIITGLGNGGAEGVLYRLVTNRIDKYNNIVVSLSDEGIYTSLLKEKNIKVYSLNMRKNGVISSIIRLFYIIKKHNPSVIQTWMYHADLIGGWVGRIAGVKNIVWGIRNTTLDKQETKIATRIIARLCAISSYFIPNKIVCCAISGVNVHKNIGYADKFVVIDNGFDIERFLPSESDSSSSREKFCREFSIDPSFVIIGMIARYAPQKDHKNLLDAIKILVGHRKNIKCLLVGYGVKDNEELVRLILERELSEYIILTDARDDIPYIMQSLDLSVLSSSFGEAFPNVIAESMLCGTPAISTDIGDAKRIIDEFGWIVPPKNERLLSKAICEAVDEIENNPEKWRERCLGGRDFIKNNFDINKMIMAYDHLWHSLFNIKK